MAKWFAWCRERWIGGFSPNHGVTRVNAGRLTPTGMIRLPVTCVGGLGETANRSAFILLVGLMHQWRSGLHYGDGNAGLVVSGRMMTPRLGARSVCCQFRVTNIFRCCGDCGENPSHPIPTFSLSPPGVGELLHVIATYGRT